MDLFEFVGLAISNTICNPVIIRLPRDKRGEAEEPQSCAQQCLATLTPRLVLT